MSARRAVSFAGRWKTKDPFCPYRGLIRMSWDKLNVYNLAIREKPEDNTRRTVFQQKWTAKRELRAYHGPDISEKQLLNRHWNNKLPMRHLTASERERLPPVQALAFGEVERRLDVALFRAHFASSLPMAKMFVTDGKVKVNGVKCKYPPRRLLPGDMVTIDPRVIPMLHQPRPAENAEEGSAEEGATEEGLPFRPVPWMSPFMFTPAYLEVSYPTTSFVFLRPPLPQPDRVEIPSPHPPEMHALAYEWYSSIRRRSGEARRRRQGQLPACCQRSLR
ncbi:hypothetical protein DFJ73DRAFT_657580 [Zopfochytrium polystomum]|nr:hypothetical protein DFJ73DRAFT_657580 [Zopfochytrium polystomum]